MSLDDDARQFGQHFKQGGWRLGLLVARNVYVSDGERGRSDLLAGQLGKVTANQFADKAGVSARTVQLYYRAWELAAEDGKCMPAEQLSLGDEDPNINLEEDYDEERDEWWVYYRKVKGAKGTRLSEQQPTDAGSKRSLAKSRKPEARLIAAIKSVEGIDVAAADNQTALRQQLQNARKRFCELIDGFVDSIDGRTPAEPENLDMEQPNEAPGAA